MLQTTIAAFFAVSSLVSHNVNPIPVKAYAAEPPPEIQKVVEEPAAVVTKQECSCVQYVRSKIPSLPKGDAVALLPNSIYPVRGGALKLSYQDGNEFDVNRYHLAYVESVEEDGVHISEKCFNSNEKTYRVIKFDDDHIRGYWNPNE